MAFTQGSTPFGYFDLDPQFVVEADRFIPYALQKLGDPTLHVELTIGQLYQSLEEATLEFSSIVNSYQAKSSLSTLLGTATGSLSGSEQRYPTKLLEFQRRMMEPYGELAGVNSNRELHSGSIELTGSVQTYDLKAFLGNGQPVQVKDIYHKSPVQAYRFFGTTSAINYLHNQFSFESFTPETIFYLLPIWEDVLRGMQFKTSNNVRRSHYSYELHNNVLTVYPTPTEARRLHIRYWLAADPYSSGSQNDGVAGGVSNLSNVPFGVIMYSKVNSIGQHWIRRMALAFAKEILGNVRGKLTSIPIPNGDLSLNGAELINDARSEMDALRQELRDMLEETSYQNLAVKEAEMAENLERNMMRVPMGIYVGTFWPIFAMFFYFFHAKMHGV